MADVGSIFQALGGSGCVGIAVEHVVDVVEVGAGLGLGPLALGVPVLGVYLLAAAQPQALARLAEGELDAGQAFFAGALSEELAGYFHKIRQMPTLPAGQRCQQERPWKQCGLGILAQQPLTT